MFHEPTAGTYLDGHVGIFEGCDGSGDHTRAGLQWVWEVQDDMAGVQRERFSRFRARARFQGIRTDEAELSPVQQHFVLDSLRSQRGVPSDYFRWKEPGRSFRCDGLVCWVYEQAGVELDYTSYEDCSPGLLFERFVCIP